jgi:hypothetical protein
MGFPQAYPQAMRESTLDARGTEAAEFRRFPERVRALDSRLPGGIQWKRGSTLMPLLLVSVLLLGIQPARAEDPRKAPVSALFDWNLCFKTKPVVFGDKNEVKLPTRSPKFECWVRRADDRFPTSGVCAPRRFVPPGTEEAKALGATKTSNATWGDFSFKTRSGSPFPEFKGRKLEGKELTEFLAYREKTEKDPKAKNAKSEKRWAGVTRVPKRERTYGAHWAPEAPEGAYRVQNSNQLLLHVEGRAVTLDPPFVNYDSGRVDRDGKPLINTLPNRSTASTTLGGFRCQAKKKGVDVTGMTIEDFDLATGKLLQIEPPEGGTDEHNQSTPTTSDQKVSTQVKKGETGTGAVDRSRDTETKSSTRGN